MANTKAKGDIGEQLAAEYLESAGYKVLERNAEYAGTEVDIIAEAYLDERGNIVKKGRESAVKAFIKKCFGKDSASGSRDTIARNAHYGERTIVFCEVKRRLGEEYGSGAEAVTPYKVGRYVRAAKLYLAAKGLGATPVRFDVIEVGYDDVHHIVSAFDTGDARYARH